MLPRVDLQRREVVIPRGGFVMPRLCACCGGPADRVTVVSGIRRSTLDLALLIATAAVAREHSLDMFVCGACFRRDRIRLALGWTAGAAVLLIGAAMMGLGDAWVLSAVGAICLGPVLVAAVTIATSRWPTLHTFDAETVTLRFRGYGFCEAFAEATGIPITDRSHGPAGEAGRE